VDLRMRRSPCPVARLTAWVPWLCVPDSHRVCPYRPAKLAVGASISPSRGRRVSLVRLTQARSTGSSDLAGNGAGQLTALRNTRRWGRVALVGEGGRLTVYGSWVSSTWRMSELLDRLVTWNLHPGKLVTDTFNLDQAALAYNVADAARRGKV
jgi:hypothetical protein